MKKILYLGLDSQRYVHSGELHHYPVIQIIPHTLENTQVSEAIQAFPSYTHCIFTSRSSVGICIDLLEQSGIEIAAWQGKTIFAVGQSTADALRSAGVSVAGVAVKECAEGVVELLQQHPMEDAYLFYPHSAISRPVIENYLRNTGLRYCSLPLYDTKMQRPEPVPALDLFDELVFTSPSTVDAFLQIFGRIPQNKQITAIGPITRQRLESVQCTSSLLGTAIEY
jgi:uroporphyrinogen-III synthase